jgi:hypothetical protein
MIQHRVELFVFFGKNNDAESPLEDPKKKELGRLAVLLSDLEQNAYFAKS